MNNNNTLINKLEIVKFSKLIKQIETLCLSLTNPTILKVVSNKTNTLLVTKKKARRLVEYALTKTSKLLVIRIDLGYKDQSKQITIEDLKQVKKDFKKLLKHLDNIKDRISLIGYVWGLERGMFSGFHYHMLIILDGQKVREDISIANQIGVHWNKVITNNNGYYHNCNKLKDTYTEPCIGLIKRTETDVIDVLITKIIPYILKPDYMFNINVKYDYRTSGIKILDNNDYNKWKVRQKLERELKPVTLILE